MGIMKQDGRRLGKTAEQQGTIFDQHCERSGFSLRGIIADTYLRLANEIAAAAVQYVRAHDINSLTHRLNKMHGEVIVLAGSTAYSHTVDALTARVEALEKALADASGRSGLANRGHLVPINARLKQVEEALYDANGASWVDELRRRSSETNVRIDNIHYRVMKLEERESHPVRYLSVDLAKGEDKTSVAVVRCPPGKRWRYVDFIADVGGAATAFQWKTNADAQSHGEKMPGGPYPMSPQTGAECFKKKAELSLNTVENFVLSEALIDYARAKQDQSEAEAARTLSRYLGLKVGEPLDGTVQDFRVVRRALKRRIRMRTRQRVPSEQSKALLQRVQRLMKEWF